MGANAQVRVGHRIQVRRAARALRARPTAPSRSATVHHGQGRSGAGRSREPVLVAQRLQQHGRRRPQVRHHQRPDPGRHDQPRLRAGRGGSVSGEPDRLRDLPERAATFFRRGQEPVFLPALVRGRGPVRRGALLLEAGRSPPAGIGRRRGGWADEPGQTTILAAAKLSGKTPSGWSIGILDAVTSEESATLAPELETRENVAVEPLSNYLIGRLSKDFRDGRSSVGAIATAVTRDRAVADAQDLRQGAYTGGLNTRHRFDQNRWEVAG